MLAFNLQSSEITVQCCAMSPRLARYTINYNVVCVLPYLIPICVIMVHFFTYARLCVHRMACATCRQTRVSVA